MMINHSAFLAVTASMIFAVRGQQFVMNSSPGDDFIERIDAVLAPGTFSQHCHDHFGSNAVGPDMTYESLLSDTTCTSITDTHNRGNTDDNSVYWIPCLFMKLKDGSGYKRLEVKARSIYYQQILKNTGQTQEIQADPFEFPPHFRMVAGNSSMRAPNSDPQAATITEWTCHQPGNNGNIGDGGGFPKGVSTCTGSGGFVSGQLAMVPPLFSLLESRV